MEVRAGWRLNTHTLPLTQRTLLMGVLNATPDSFSDGGMWSEPEAAIEHGLEMLEQGADVIDVGGESTRPGSTPVTPLEEQSRVLPVIRGLLRQAPHAVLSIDTTHAETARLALEAGAEIVNDVSGGLWDQGMRSIWAASGCGVVLMHTRGRPSEWRSQAPLAPDQVVPLVVRELRACVDKALSSGVARETIVLDPGIGFGKLLGENFPLLAGISDVCALGFPVAAGVSRKGFLRKAMEEIQPGLASAGTRLAEALRDATIAASTAAVLAGAQMLRTHDIIAAHRAAVIAEQIRKACRESGQQFTVPFASA